MRMSDIAIKADHISKIYKMYKSSSSRLKESLHPRRKKYHTDFYALNDVSFEIKRGETYGIIGKNGSGKSTLLKIITGVLTPSAGAVMVNGRISALLELGAGFNPEFTGLENVYFQGSILGFSRKEIENRLDDILSFADIGEFIHQPVKTYSSGMYVRLAFSIATCIEPEILIVDEALSVGDMYFQAKCMARMTKMINDNGVTLLFVSHSIRTVQSLCRNAIWLDKGGIRENGDSSSVCKNYSMLDLVKKQNTITVEKIKENSLVPDPDFDKKASFDRYQNGMAAFINVKLLNLDAEPVSLVGFHEQVVLRCAIEILEDIHRLEIGYSIKNSNGVQILGTSSEIEGRSVLSLQKGEKYLIDFKFKIPLAEGQYNIQMNMSIPIDVEMGQYNICDRIPCALQFEVRRRPNGRLWSAVRVENKIEIKSIEK
jgi:lipopolysaccharide transport system ATP-binding protein